MQGIYFPCILFFTSKHDVLILTKIVEEIFVKRKSCQKVKYFYTNKSAYKTGELWRVLHNSQRDKKREEFQKDKKAERFCSAFSFYNRRNTSFTALVFDFNDHQGLSHPKTFASLVLLASKTFWAGSSLDKLAFYHFSVFYEQARWFIR